MMQNRIEIGKKYFNFLQQSDLQGLASLFADDGTVISPIYGVKKHTDFYKSLIEDTSESIIQLKEIYAGVLSKNLAIHFEYKWTLKDGKVVDFEGVDVFEFDENDKIKKLSIIYDPAQTRQLFA